MPNPKLADIDFALEWKSPFASHKDVFHLPKFDSDNDVLPLNFGEKIAALKVGQSCQQTFQAKEFLGEEFSSEKVITFAAELFDREFKGQNSPPNLYRFYPSAIAWQGLDTEENDYSPFRLITMRQNELVADCNHPLAKYYLSLTATKVNTSNKAKNTQQRKRDIAKLITAKGPGMQAPFEFGDPIFFDKYPFSQSFEQTALLPPLDALITENIATLYSQLLPKHSKILDVMSDKHSYLSDNYETGLLVGLGTNEAALSANHRLDTYQVQDLNEDTNLPFVDDNFDNAICTLAFDSLSKPLEIISEIARVVCKDGKFIVTFTQQYSQSSAITLWGQLHPFERMQFVLECFRKTELFEELNTYSNRGLSDPVFAVWGTVK